MLPELTFGDDVVIPSYYGKNCVTGVGLRKSFYLRFEQPDLVKTDGSFAYGLGAVVSNGTLERENYLRIRF